MAQADFNLPDLPDLGKYTYSAYFECVFYISRVHILAHIELILVHSTLMLMRVREFGNKQDSDLQSHLVGSQNPARVLKFVGTTPIDESSQPAPFFQWPSEPELFPTASNPPIRGRLQKKSGKRPFWGCSAAPMSTLIEFSPDGYHCVPHQ